MKKLFIIFSVLFGVTLLFWGVYNFAFRKNESTDRSQIALDTAKEAQKFLTAKNGQGRIYPITEEAVLAPVFDKKQEKILYYAKNDGTTWRIDGDGKNKEQVSGKKVSGLKNVQWNGERTRVISEIENGNGKKFFAYSLAEDSAQEIKKDADLIVWDNSGTKLIYKYFNQQTQERSLNVAEADGSNFKVLADKIPYRKLSFKAIPQTSLVAFWNFPNAKEETKLQTVSVLGGESKTIWEKRYGADFLWSPDGEKALISSLAAANDKKINLGVVDLAGKYTDLDFPTLVQKCAWSVDKKSVYCALPGDIAAEAVLPDDYLASKLTTKDTFWKIDLTTGAKERIVELAELKNSYDANSMFLSASEDALFFVNRTDSRLYRIEL